MREADSNLVKFKRSKGRRRSITMGKLIGLGTAVTLCLVFSSPFAGSTAPQEERPAFVIVERTATTGPQAIQQEYAELARQILPTLPLAIWRAARRTPCWKVMGQFHVV